MVFLAVLAVWAIIGVLEEWLVLPRWAWGGLGMGLGVGAQMLIEPSDWWLGLGIGGAALLLRLFSDLLLVLTDWIRLHVLRRTR